MSARTFTAGQVMTVLAGGADRVFCSYGELLDVVGWLRQDVPASGSWGAAIAECRAHVEAVYPGLAELEAPPAGASDAEVLSWLAAIEAEHGAAFELAPIDEAGE